MKNFRKTNKKNKSKKNKSKKNKSKIIIKKRLFRGGTLGFELQDKDGNDITIDEMYFEDDTTYGQLRQGLSRVFNNLSTDYIILKPSPLYQKLKEPDYENVISNSIAIIKVEITEPAHDKIAEGMPTVSFNPYEAKKSNTKSPKITHPGLEIFGDLVSNIKSPKITHPGLEIFGDLAIFSDDFWNNNIRVYDRFRYAYNDRDRKHLDLSKLKERTKFYFVRFVDEGIIRIFGGVYGGNDENGNYLFEIILNWAFK
jgi:hypothetical protein